ncbi:MAG: hypothetical protein KBT88_11080 [Gammaproteobacteria bacterium]|nr:hypothetical protein [Gammaproteobacteria bacterium]MBQ0840317.1 hypothetical protein [Gammaproteobacteria bacterium]
MSMDNSSNDSTSVTRHESTEVGDYDFEFGAVLSESWERTKGLKGSFWAAGAIVFLVVLVVGAAVGGGSALLVGNGGVAGGGLPPLILQLVITALMYPVMAGVMMLGIERSVDLPLSYKSVFGYFAYTLPLLGVAVLMTLLLTIGFLLLIIPGIYLSLAYMFAVPLVVEKNLGIWDAMETSRKAVTSHWFKLFFLFLIMSIIMVISALPFGIGLIWTYPMMVAMMGVMYRDIFGVEAVESSLQ